MKIKKYLPPLVMWLVFEAIAAILWLTLDNIFYLFNFSYIGAAIATGLVLIWAKKKIRPECSTVCSRSIYACISGFHLPRKYADRGFLVLSFPRRIRSRYDPLCRCKNIWPVTVWARVVRLCLLDLQWS